MLRVSEHVETYVQQTALQRPDLTVYFVGDYGRWVAGLRATPADPELLVVGDHDDLREERKRLIETERGIGTDAKVIKNVRPGKWGTITMPENEGTAPKATIHFTESVDRFFEEQGADFAYDPFADLAYSGRIRPRNEKAYVRADGVGIGVLEHTNQFPLEGVVRRAEEAVLEYRKGKPGSVAGKVKVELVEESRVLRSWFLSVPYVPAPAPKVEEESHTAYARMPLRYANGDQYYGIGPSKSFKTKKGAPLVDVLARAKLETECRADGLYFVVDNKVYRSDTGVTEYVTHACALTGGKVHVFYLPKGASEDARRDECVRLLSAKPGDKFYCDGKGYTVPAPASSAATIVYRVTTDTAILAFEASPRAGDTELAKAAAEALAAEGFGPSVRAGISTSWRKQEAYATGYYGREFALPKAGSWYAVFAGTRSLYFVGPTKASTADIVALARKVADRRGFAVPDGAPVSVGNIGTHDGVTLPYGALPAWVTANWPERK
jgi:hypothetical protein